MDQINIGVTTDASAAADQLTKVSTSIDKVQTATEKMNAANVNASRLIAQNEAESRKFIAALKEEAATYGKSREEIIKYRAAQLGVSSEAKALVDQLKQVHGGEIKSAGEAMEQFGFQTAGAKRELLVLAHEASQGNWKRFAGSLMVVGERTNAMGLLFSSAGLALGAFAGAAALVAYDVYKMSEAVNDLNKSLVLTNNYAGLTRDGFASMAEEISSKATGGIGKAKEMLSGLASTGKFTGGELAAVSKTALSFALITGQSTEEVIKKFDGMSGGVAKWAIEANSSYHFLTSAQLEEIETLEKQGKSQLAVMETMKLLNAQLDKHRDHVGPLSAIWKGWGIIIDGVNSSLQKSFFPTIGEQVKVAIAQLAELKKQSAPYEAVGMHPYAAAIDAQKAKIKELIALSNSSDIAAGNKQKNDLLQASGISAHERLKNEWNLLAGSIAKADDEIKKFRQDYQTALAANPKDADALDAQKNAAKIEKAIRKKYDKTDFKAENKLNNAYDSTFQSLGADKAKLDEEINEFERYGKVVDRSHLAVLNFEISAGKLKGLSSERAGILRGMATAADAEAEQLVGIKSIKVIEDKIKAIQAEAAVQGQNKDVTKEALLMKDLDAIKTSISADNYDRLKTSIHESTQALEKHDATNMIATMERGTSDKIAKIKEEADLVGKSALEHKELAAALEIEAKAREAIAKAPDQAEAINASASAQIKAITAALRDSEQEQRTWSRGMDAALKNYADQASNDAALTQGLFTNAFNSAENAMTKFLQTGKLDFKSFADSIIADLARIEAKKIISSLMGGSSSGGSGFSSIMSMFNSSSSSSAFNGSDWAVQADQMSMSGYAGGGDPPVGVPSIVGEAGPEIFVPKQSGTIIPNSKLGGGGQSITYAPVIQIDSRSDQAQIQSMVSGAVRQGNAELVERLQRQNKLRN